MRSQFFILILFFFQSIGFSQKSPNLQTGVNNIYITGQIVGAKSQTIKLINQNLGSIEQPVYTAVTDEAGVFSIDTFIPFSDYYFFILENNQFLNLVLHQGDSIKIYGDAKDLSLISNIIGSKDSELLNEFSVKYNAFKMVQDSLMQVLRRNPAKQEEVNTYFEPLAKEFYGYRNNYLTQHQNSPAIIGSLASFNQEKEWDAYKRVINLLNQSFSVSPTVQKMEAFVAQNDVKIQQQQKQAKAEAEMFAPGVLAKEIALPNVDGEIIKLSDLRGKVVLIDFWASWCGPCRKENPNVVKAYKKYNEAGFEIYSVSLDKASAKGKWLAAIEQDGLIWDAHVSDLKGWNSAAAADYGVRSIPFTLLIDAEGKVIKSNLRGAALENELKSIFGF
ncbi:TlpA family protein disulfide reductase [Crocinitomix catalasitica]|uniref:TlpA family protein disulfide reductase n=1 Tax=Crocinitomix catalasitica TaxID=184607 RepID=UPI0009FE940B|nr:TlpA disulfide reductase family protein [Crocinitomix catalasitica]